MAAPEDYINTFYKSIGALVVESQKRVAKDISNHTSKVLHQLEEKKEEA